MVIAKWVLMLIRLGAGVQVVLGIGFWTGHWAPAIPAHRTIGVVYVVLLWVLAVVAMIKRANIGLALFAIAWGVAIAALGFTQQQILVGSSHWIIRVVHLVVSLAAMPIAERLARGASTASTAA
jgi:hypothetical protein